MIGGRTRGKVMEWDKGIGSWVAAIFVVFDVRGDGNKVVGGWVKWGM